MDDWATNSNIVAGSIVAMKGKRDEYKGKHQLGGMNVDKECVSVLDDTDLAWDALQTVKASIVTVNSSTIDRGE